ncbi:MAG: Hsp20/alpha crystallin family protein [Dehalococcoidia bacterium]|nr:Hsp20/alpha crystallin family protein [Dehalococcoidia bacterium]
MPNTLTRWDPFNELTSMRNMMDRLFESSVGRLPALRNTGEDLGTSALGLDVYETNDCYVVKASVPGVDPKDVDISVEDDILTIKGQFEQKDEAKEDNYLRRELRYGSFQRSLRLPPTVDAETARAEFENGILKLSLPKKPEARARSIKITPHGVLEGESEPMNQPQHQGKQGE